MIDSIDTLTYDLDKIARYQADPRYDYNSQLQPIDTSWWEALVNRLARLLQRLFHGLDAERASSIVTWSLVVLFVLALIVVIWFIWKSFTAPTSIVPSPTPLPEAIIRPLSASFTCRRSAR